MTIHRKLKVVYAIAALMCIVVFAEELFFLLRHTNYPGRTLICMMLVFLAAIALYVGFRRVSHDERLPLLEQRFKETRTRFRRASHR